ncbi:MAG: nuclear transport factor 2 family protein [Pseudomonadota bacterium]
MPLAELIDFYETLSPESVQRFPEFYSETASFKDPFNEVVGVSRIQHIFQHMFEQVDAPRFVITEVVQSAQGTQDAMLVWILYCRMRFGGNSEVSMRGVSHLKFDLAGKVYAHRDYWDTAEELYMKLPVLACLMRWLRQRLSAG